MGGMFANVDLRSVSREGLAAITVEQEAAMAGPRRRLRETGAGLAETVSAAASSFHPQLTPQRDGVRFPRKR